MSLYSTRAVKNLKKMIVDAGLSSEKVAFGADISKATISKYLSGQRTPTIPVLEKIAKFLGRDFQDFFRP
jgi:transcriptional regulator with XRE-family HTH domain